MSSRVVVAALLLSAGCQFPRPQGEYLDTDGPPGGLDAPEATDGHLLISEIRSIGPAEFIEIWNPTNRDVLLDRYYLADVGDYWRLPDASIDVNASDFLVRFRTGATLRAGAVLTVALRALDFQSEYGMSPTYAIDAASGSLAMADRQVPSLASLTDPGEIVALFVWDGVSDLVKDVDLVVTGSAPSPANRFVSRGGASIDGPDADLSATAYASESELFGGGMTADAPTTTSSKRRARETGRELQLGTGNSISGDDETSEQLGVTWDGSASYPFTAPTPGVAPAF